MAFEIDPRTFAETLTATAAWRREKSEEFPDDRDRNAQAADLLESLADGIEDLDDEELAPLALAIGDYDYPQAEIVTGYIGRIGFDHHPANAKELVRDLAAELGEDA